MTKLAAVLSLLLAATAFADTAGLPVKGTALHLSPQAGAPPAACLPVGQVCIWFDSNTSMWKFRGPSGTDITSGYSTFAYAGTPLTQRATLNLTGSGVSCVDNSGAGRTDCTFSLYPGTAVANTSNLAALAGTIPTTYSVIVRSVQMTFVTEDGGVTWKAY